MQIAEKKALAFRKIHEDFKEIMKHDKCRYCSCFHGDVLGNVHNALRFFNESQPEHGLKDIEKDFEKWTSEADLLKMHG